jgi:hypothetical protein
MEILRGEGHQQNALLQLANDLRFTAQKSLACGARLSKGRSENNEAILERTSGILLEQKLDQSFDNFMRSAASVGRAQKYLFMWLENLYITDGPPENWRTPHRLYRGAQADRDNVYRPTHSVGHLLAWL